MLDRGVRAGARDLDGRHVVVSAGGTREPIDPVRFIGNRSSGLQGYALARTALARGARVTLVAANAALPDPAGAASCRSGSAREMREAVLKAAADADAVVMAAAVADFRPADYEIAKIKKTAGVRPGPDPARWRTPTSWPRSYRPRVPRKGRPRWSSGSPPRPMTCSNTVGENSPARVVTCSSSTRWGSSLTFGAPDNAAVILSSDGAAVEVPRGTEGGTCRRESGTWSQPG